ncbi:Transposase IS801 [Edwardsiella anguillarum]|nr:Transposase IS801 [Edwardsiella anguillarum]
MKGFLSTTPYEGIQCKSQLRFTGAGVDEHAAKMLSDRLSSDGEKRWLQTPLLDNCA